MGGHALLRAGALWVEPGPGRLQQLGRRLGWNVRSGSAPEFHPPGAPQTPRVLDGSCPGDRGGVASREDRGGGPQGWARGRAMGGGGHACGTWLTLKSKIAFRAAAPFQKEARTVGWGPRCPRGAEVDRGQWGGEGPRGRVLRALGWLPEGSFPFGTAPPSPPAWLHGTTGGPPAEAWSLTS